MKTLTIWLLSLGVVFTLTAAPAYAQQKPEIKSLSSSDKALKATEEYWTEERMKAAKPMPLPKISPEQFKKMKSMPGTKDAPPGTFRSIEPYHPDSGMLQGTPTPANVGQRPYWNGGKFFFTKPGAGDYVCSAEFVGNNRVIMTAAHCVIDGSSGNWYTNFAFRRAYNNGGGQSVGWKCATVYTAYFTGGSANHAFDYAFLNTSNISGAGWLGFATGVPYASWTSIGYPVNYGSTQRMYQVVGTKGTVGSTVQMIGNPMGGGSSGGAWIGDLTVPHVGGNYAIGLNSFHYTSTPNDEYSPLFNTSTYNLLTAVMAKTGC